MKLYPISRTERKKSILLHIIFKLSGVMKYASAEKLTPSVVRATQVDRSDVEVLGEAQVLAYVVGGRSVADVWNSTLTDLDGNYLDGEDEDGKILDYEADFPEQKVMNDALACDVKSMVDTSCETASHLVETTFRLNKCGVTASSELVVKVGGTVE
ncbi:hypothetical protein NL676_036975 [Syzygium grande]|nr:hypothetical protein NL676_036975 [Syzygium grande]